MRFGWTSSQGSHFTPEGFTDIFASSGIKISMDGKGHWMDNIFIERLWKTVKYEDIYLKAYSSIADVRKGLKDYFERYNSRRRHQSLGDRTPDEVYLTTLPEAKEAV